MPTTSSALRALRPCKYKYAVCVCVCVCKSALRVWLLCKIEIYKTINNI